MGKLFTGFLLLVCVTAVFGKSKLTQLKSLSDAKLDSSSGKTLTLKDLNSEERSRFIEELKKDPEQAAIIEKNPEYINLFEMTESELNAHFAAGSDLNLVETQGCTEFTPAVCPGKYNVVPLPFPRVNGCGPEWASFRAKYPTLFAALSYVRDAIFNRLPFNPCCDAHDLCYGGTPAFERFPRSFCDNTFRTCNAFRCGAVFPVSKTWFGIDSNAVIRAGCNQIGGAMADLVTSFGCQPFYDGRKVSHCRP